MMTWKLLALVGLALFAMGCGNKKLENLGSDQGPQATPTPAPVGPFAKNLRPTNGTGGTVAPGATGSGPQSTSYYIPTSYKASDASAVLITTRMGYNCFKPTADADNTILVQNFDDGNLDNEANRVEAVVQELSSKYNIDKARIYLAGFSGGGEFTLIFGSDLNFNGRNNQGYFAGVMAFAAIGITSADTPTPSSSRATANSRNNTGRKLPFYFAEGDNDTLYKGSTKIVANAIKAIPGYSDRVIWQSMGNVGHVAPAGSQCTNAWNWLRVFNTVNK